MSTTYLTLVNDVCDRLNEVALTSGNFASATGVYLQIKEAVNAALVDINSDQFRWPFNYSGASTQTLTSGTQTYSYPVGARDLDFDTFQLVRDDTLNPPAVNAWLVPIDYPLYCQRYRDIDLALNSDGFTFPRGVVRLPDNASFLITPIPDQAYKVKFDVWSNPANLSASTDTTTVPDNFTNVITDGAMYYMYMFRSAPDLTRIAQDNFTKGIASMRRVLIPFDVWMRDTRIGPYQRSF